MEKVKKIAIKNYIGAFFILFINVCFLAIHMYSYFIRLVFKNENAANEFMIVTDLVQGKFKELKSVFFFPSAIITWLSSFVFSDVEIYKGFIISEVLLFVFEIIFFYLTINILFSKSNEKSKIKFLVVSIIYFYGMPAYRFLSGGYIVSTIETILSMILILILNYFHGKLCEIKLNSNIRKILFGIGIILTVNFFNTNVPSEFIFFMPIIMFVLFETIWKQKTSGLLILVQQTINLFAIIVQYMMKSDGIYQTIKVTILSVYWMVCLMLAVQAIHIVKKNKCIIEAKSYLFLILILLVLQISCVQEKIKVERPEMIQDIDGQAKYFNIINYNVDLIKTDYTSDDKIFFGSADFIELAQYAKAISDNQVSIFSDEITTTEGTWFSAISGKHEIRMDGLNCTEQDILNALTDTKSEYVVIFSDSRIYMLHYDFLMNYKVYYQNDKGIILRIDS